jgi:hypothetical protein
MSVAPCASPLAAALILLALVRLRLAARRAFRPPRLSSSLFRKETAMTDLPSIDANVPAVPSADAPIVTASADPAPAVADPHRVVGAVVQSVTSHPDVHPSKAAGVIASILAGLYQAEPAIFAVSRAGARTQAEVSLGLGLAEVILGAFLHPAG